MVRAQKNRGFTVLELSIALAIAVMFATVATIGAGTARQKASLAKAQAMYNEKKSLLFEKTRYRFSFDNNSLASSSIVSSTATQSSYETSIVADTTLFNEGYYLSLGGSGSGTSYPGIYFNNTDIGNIMSDYNATLALWYKPIGITGGDRVVAGIAEDTNVGAQGLSILANSSLGRFRVWLAGNYMEGPNFENDTWYYLIASVKNNGGNNVTVNLYVNGELYTQNFSNVVNTGGLEDTISVGSSCCTQFRAFGIYDEIIIADTSI